MLHGPRRVGLYCSPGKHGLIIMRKYHERGQKCPVAVVAGMHPSMVMLGGIEIPYGKNELEAAGGIRAQYAVLNSFGVFVPYIYGEVRRQFREIAAIERRVVRRRHAPLERGGDLVRDRFEARRVLHVLQALGDELPGPRQHRHAEPLGEGAAAIELLLADRGIGAGLRHQLQARDEMHEFGELDEDLYEELRIKRSYGW